MKNKNNFIFSFYMIRFYKYKKLYNVALDQLDGGDPTAKQNLMVENLINRVAKDTEMNAVKFFNEYNKYFPTKKFFKPITYEKIKKYLKESSIIEDIEELEQEYNYKRITKCHIPSTFYNNNYDELLCLFNNKRLMIYEGLKSIKPIIDGLPFDKQNKLLYLNTETKEIYNYETIKEVSINESTTVFIFIDIQALNLFLNILHHYRLYDIPTMLSFNETIFNFILGIFLGYRIYDILHYISGGMFTINDFQDYDEEMDLGPNPIRRLIKTLKASRISVLEWNNIGAKLLEVINYLLEMCDLKYKKYFEKLKTALTIVIEGAGNTLLE